MEDITRLTVHELVEKLNKNELSSEKIVKAYKARIEDKEKDVKAFITTTLDEAEKEAVKVQAQHTEESSKEGLIREYLHRLLPVVDRRSRRSSVRSRSARPRPALSGARVLASGIGTRGGESPADCIFAAALG